MKKLTMYEWVVLLLGMAFLFCCVVWLAGQRTFAPGWQVSTERSDPAVIQSSHSRPDSLLKGETIDLNAASRSDLLRLPDIGAVRADAILSYREEHGPFQTVDDLLNVFGIGPATLEQLRPYICVG